MEDVVASGDAQGLAQELVEADGAGLLGQESAGCAGGTKPRVQVGSSLHGASAAGSGGDCLSSDAELRAAQLLDGASPLLSSWMRCCSFRCFGVHAAGFQDLNGPA